MCHTKVHPFLHIFYGIARHRRRGLQADTVLAHFIFEDAQSMETIRNSFDYYEKVTTHDSSLSTCIISIMASKLGLEEKAYEYFGDSAKLDLFNTHKNTKDGIHTANMGGNFMAIVYGFAGLRIKEDGIYFAPAIPKQWEEYKFQINYEDSQIKVKVNMKESIYTLVKGTTKPIHVYGKCYELKDANGDPSGVLGVCTNFREEKLDYYIAASSEDKVPEGMDELKIPASLWVVFKCVGAMPKAIQEVWKRIFTEWFPSSGYEHAGGSELEWYSDGDSSLEDYVSEIWIPIVKK